MSSTQAVNRSVNIRSEIRLGARADVPAATSNGATPYRRVPDLPTTPSVAGEHDPAAPSPPQGVPGSWDLRRLPPRPLARTPGTAPRAARARRARGRPDPCAVRAAGGGASRAHLWSWRKRQRRLRRPAHARSDLQPPQPPHRPRQRPPRQRLAAAVRRPSGGLNTCGTRQARLCEPGEVRPRGWCNVRPVTRM